MRRRHAASLSCRYLWSAADTETSAALRVDEARPVSHAVTRVLRGSSQFTYCVCVMLSGQRKPFRFSLDSHILVPTLGVNVFLPPLHVVGLSVCVDGRNRTSPDFPKRIDTGNEQNEIDWNRDFNSTIARCTVCKMPMFFDYIEIVSLTTAISLQVTLAGNYRIQKNTTAV